MKRFAPFLLFDLLVACGALFFAQGSAPVVIDQAWLAANGGPNGPWQLAQANTTYRLATDPQALDTAFIVAAPGVILTGDHKITYQMRALPGLSNGDFSQGTAGWDVSGAPGALAQPPRLGMPGAGQLHCENFTAPIKIVSAPVPIVVTGREYCATCTLKGNPWNVSASIDVIDTVTGSAIASASNTQTGRGFALQTTFSPGVANPLQLRITVTPVAGATSSVDIGYCQLLPSRDYGVLASPNVFSFPAQLRQYTGARNASNFTLAGPRIVQAGRGLASHPIYCQGLAGLTVDQVDVAAAGMDCLPLYGGYTNGVTVTRSIFRSQVLWLSNRMLVFASIDLPRPNGNVTIDHNFVLDSPQAGVAVYQQTAGVTTITNNYVRQNALVSDPYAILVYGLPAPVISNNQMVPVNGRGLLIDGDSNGVTSSAVVTNNYALAQERPNLEYPTGQGLEATGLRLRNFVRSAGGYHQCTFSGNTWTAQTGPGQVWCAIGARITGHNDQSQMQAANNTLAGDTFRAVVYGTDANQRALGLSISGVDGGTGLTFSHCALTSNDTALCLGDNDDHGLQQDVTFDTCHLIEVGPGRTWTPVLTGWFGSTDQNIRLLHPLSDLPIGSPPGVIIQ